VGKLSPYRRTRAIAEGSNAAARLRRKVRRDGWALCASCGFSLLPSAVDIDHRIPLYKGGTDTDDNVQILCRAVCHKVKTRDDMQVATPPF
jgi:5-methylcytosine-specific restriction protein A